MASKPKQSKGRQCLLDNRLHWRSFNVGNGIPLDQRYGVERRLALGFVGTRKQGESGNGLAGRSAGLAGTGNRVGATPIRCSPEYGQSVEPARIGTVLGSEVKHPQ